MRVFAAGTLIHHLGVQVFVVFDKLKETHPAEF
jgi:hypothetical protein